MTLARKSMPFAAIALVSVLSCHGEAVDSRTEKFGRLPNWSGIWVTAEPIGTINIDGYAKFNPVVDWKLLGFAAPYNDAAQAARNTLLTGEVPNFKALSWGFPYMMESPTPLQFLITPEETLILNFYSEARHIYTDGRGHPAEEDRWPTPWGDSIGHWEGDILVIETIAVERFGPASTLGPWMSEEAVYVERLRMTSPDRIESEFTVTDPATLKEPWVVNLSYRRAPNFDRMFHMPFDNDRTTKQDGVFTIAPSAVEAE